jgi:hypothetical protein
MKGIDRKRKGNERKKGKEVKRKGNERKKGI